MTGSWRDLPSHRAWLDAELVRLLGFARDPSHPIGGFAVLDGDGRPEVTAPVHTWITCRMTHVHALAHLRGLPGSSRWIDHGIAALTDLLWDDQHGGWFAAIAADGTPDGTKDAYQHAFVVLAASSATAAGRPGAAELLDRALEVLAARFLDEGAGRLVESYDRTWGDCEAYRGANSNMHAVEALLAAGDVTGDVRWHSWARRIATALIDDVARSHDWRVVEHFDARWNPLPGYNQDQPDHPFRPYGVTPGHQLEWARLLLHLEAGAADAPAWLLPAARSLFHAAMDRGWAADGAPGIVYTLGWQDEPVVTNRLHWVVAEGIAAAAALHQRTGEERYEDWYRRLWDHAVAAFLDRDAGSWHHELDAQLQPVGVSGTWAGKPDLYHAVQATLLPQLRLTPSLAAQLATGGD
jgi:sulfoquinovose isomerase